MKKYRIKDNYGIGFIVQKRCCYILWETIKYNFRFGTNKIFSTLEDAQSFVNELKEKESNAKTKKYIEYL